MIGKTSRLSNVSKILVCAGILLFIVLLVLVFNYNKSSTLNRTHVVMGTFLNQTVVSKTPEDVVQETYIAIKGLENKISWRIENSDISKINKANKLEWVDVSEDTADELGVSLNIAKQTDGAFDPAILPISKLWDFTSDEKKVPGDLMLKEAVSVSGYANVEFDKNLKRARKLTAVGLIDLGGVGKGAACDKALAVYKKNGVKSAIVSVGGSVGVYGEKKDNSPFNIAIRDPITTDNNTAEFAQIKIMNGCVSTSGAYERNFTIDGKFYHHILDIKSGYPVDNSLASVTVYHKSGIMTDILSTACYVQGKEKSLPVLRDYGAEAVFVDKDKDVFITKGLRDKFYITNPDYILRDWY